MSSIDDFVADGDVTFTVTTSLLSSGDDTYAELDYDYDFRMVSLDDPDDYMLFNAAGVVVEMADGSSNYTTESGGSVTVNVYLK